MKPQPNNLHYLSRLSETNAEVFNFVAKAKYEDRIHSLTSVEIDAAAEWIDAEMLRRHKVAKQGGRPRTDNASKATLYQRARRARIKAKR